MNYENFDEEIWNDPDFIKDLNKRAEEDESMDLYENGKDNE